MIAQATEAGQQALKSAKELLVTVRASTPPPAFEKGKKL